MNLLEYAGKRTDDGCKVVKVVSDVEQIGTDEHGVVVRPRNRSIDLPTRTDLKNHSPTGFEFGYAGSGPSQLALAIMADFLGNDQKALEYYYYFKMEVITGLRGDTFRLTKDQVARWVYSYENRNNPPNHK